VGEGEPFNKATPSRRDKPEIPEAGILGLIRRGALRKREKFFLLKYLNIA
jgi:hypothetical protein